MPMSGIILDGKKIAKSIEQELIARVARLKKMDLTPTLATILVGDDPASETYVRMKGNACQRVGMESIKIHLPSETTTYELLCEIARLNNDHRVNGILLQHPVPAHIDERACFDRIALSKDVDGVTTAGFGLMAMGQPAYGSATPAGIMRLLKEYNIPITGLHAVVVGRSPILGKPVAMMLSNANATVTICHSKTENLSAIIRQADIVVGAVGKPAFISDHWIKPNAIIIDAGYHPGPMPVGDIELSDKLKAQCYAYTPVPGGVGPMTIAILLENTVKSTENKWSSLGIIPILPD